MANFLAPVTTRVHSWLQPVGGGVMLADGGGLKSVASARTGPQFPVRLAAIVVAVAAAAYYFLMRKGDSRHKHKY